MAQFCGYCGKEIPAGQAFCPYCGNPAAGGVQNRNSQTAGNEAVRTGIPAPGYSDRVNDPEILAAVKKNRKAGALFGFIVMPLPLIGFAIYGLVSDEIELKTALLIGGIISAVFLIFSIVGAIKNRARKAYEAVVTDKNSTLVYRRSNTDNARTVTEYITVVKTTAGKKIKIKEREGSQLWAWPYLNVGDRFRYHPQFSFPYELYDKSRAPWIACVSCGMKNPVSVDRCGKCGIPLLK